MSRSSARYSSEIRSMMVTFGVLHPDEDTLIYVEEIIRSQLCDLVMAARDLAAKRGSRLVQTEDIAFLQRHDPARCARIQAFLAWKDTARRGTELDQDESDALDELVASTLAAAPSSREWTWDVCAALGQGIGATTEVACTDQDQLASFAHSVPRLRTEDELVKAMPLSEYTHFIEGKQASFTYKKGKKFRDFLALGATIDAALIEDITDVLGFIGREIVKQLCETGLALNRKVTRPAKKRSTVSLEMPPPPVPLKRTRTTEGASSPVKSEALAPVTSGSTSEGPSAAKRPRVATDLSLSDAPPDSAFNTPRTLSYLSRADASPSLPPEGPFSIRAPSPPPSATTNTPVADVTSSTLSGRSSTIARKPLGTREVDDALALVLQDQHRSKCHGLRNFQRGWSMNRARYA